MNKKHKGAWAELAATNWLLEQGYEVFRNVSQHGDIDIIARKGAEQLVIDVKSGSAYKGKIYGHKLSKSQKELGVKLLIANQETGKIFFHE